MTTIILGNANNLSASDDNSNTDTIIVGNGFDDTVSANDSIYDKITLGDGAGGQRMRCRRATLDAAHMQPGSVKLHLVPSKVNQIGRPPDRAPARSGARKPCRKAARALGIAWTLGVRAKRLHPPQHPRQPVPPATRPARSRSECRGRSTQPQWPVGFDSRPPVARRPLAPPFYAAAASRSRTRRTAIAFHGAPVGVGTARQSKA
jgi:hypothetical protein